MTARKLRQRGGVRHCDRQLNEQRRRLALVARQQIQGLTRLHGLNRPECAAPNESKSGAKA